MSKIEQTSHCECCDLLEELQLKLIAMSCFAQEHYSENAYDVTQMAIDEIRAWIKKKREQHCSKPIQDEVNVPD